MNIFSYVLGNITKEVLLRFLHVKTILGRKLFYNIKIFDSYFNRPFFDFNNNFLEHAENY